MRIMVLGAGGPAADNYIKSLRLADPGIYTLGVDTHPLMLELSSATETVVLETDLEYTYLRYTEIADLIERHGITMVHAQPDQETLWISGQEDLPTSTPDVRVVQACQDKLRCAELLGDLAPESYEFSADRFPSDRITKPQWMRARTGAGSLAAKRVDYFQDADAWLKVWRGRVDRSDFMLSEYLPGEDRSYTGVWWRGEPVASACRVRVEYADTRTPSGQCSSPRIAKLDSRSETFDVAEQAIRRVSEATGTQPHGVFYVDMREAADGRLLVTEINAGRFNTTQNFYAEAGLNLPYLHARLHHGVDPWLLQVEPGAMRLDYRDSEGTERADVYWLRQPDMGHKLLVKTRVTVGS